MNKLLGVLLLFALFQIAYQHSAPCESCKKKHRNKKNKKLNFSTSCSTTHASTETSVSMPISSSAESNSSAKPLIPVAVTNKSPVTISEPTPQTTVAASEASLGSTARVGKASYYTFYNQNPGSCGYIPKTNMIAALSPVHMKAACDKCILVEYGGKNLKVQVTDTCMGCDENKIDLSDEAFKYFAPLDQGILDGIKWDFVPC